MEIVYWGIKARAYAAQVVAAYKGLPLTTSTDRANKWPEDKSICHFGQLPLLIDGDIKVNQSLAILNYIGHKAKAQGETDADFGMSQMLVSEYSDLFEGLAKCMYAGDDAAKAAAWKKCVPPSPPDTSFYS